MEALRKTHFGAQREAQSHWQYQVIHVRVCYREALVGYEVGVVDA